MSCGHVDPLVTHDHRASQRELKILGRAFEQAGLGLAARTLVLGGVRAHVDSVQLDSVRAQPPSQVAHDLVNAGAREQATRHAGLVRHHHDRVAGGLKPAQRLRNPGQDLEVRRVRQIPHLAHQRAVTVHEHRRPRRAPTLPSERSLARSLEDLDVGIPGIHRGRGDLVRPQADALGIDAGRAVAERGRGLGRNEAVRMERVPRPAIEPGPSSDLVEPQLEHHAACSHLPAEKRSGGDAVGISHHQLGARPPQGVEAEQGARARLPRQSGGSPPAHLVTSQGEPRGGSGEAAHPDPGGNDQDPHETCPARSEGA